MPTVPISEPEAEGQGSLMGQPSQLPSWLGLSQQDTQSKSMINEAVRSFMEEQRRKVASEAYTAKAPSDANTETIAQRIFDAHAAFHPADPGKAMPTPTDEEMAQYIGKAKIPTAGLRAIAGRVSDFVDSLNRKRKEAVAQ